MVLTAISDISSILALALDDDRPWPVVGGMQGVLTTPAELLELGKKLRPGKWNVEYLDTTDVVDRGELKSTWVPRFDHPAVAEAQREAFSRHFVVTFARAMEGGKWVVGREWNERYSEYNFMGLEEYLGRAWEGKA